MNPRLRDDADGLASYLKGCPGVYVPLEMRPPDFVCDHISRHLLLPLLDDLVRYPFEHFPHLLETARVMEVVGGGGLPEKLAEECERLSGWAYTAKGHGLYLISDASADWSKRGADQSVLSHLDLAGLRRWFEAEEVRNWEIFRRNGLS